MPEAKYILVRLTKEANRKGLKIRIPADPSRTIPPKGCRMKYDTFVQRRINDGDLEIVDEQKPTAKKAAKAPEGKK